jgi:cullin-4
MFKDIDISREFMASYRTSKSHDQLRDMDLFVNVLTQGFWPTYPPAEVTIPPQMAQYQEHFQNFYLSKHSGRRLHWQNSLGHCVLKASFPKGLKELSVSLFQSVVLLLFNDTSKKTITYKEIKQETNIDDKELARTLQSLSVGKVRVLHKTRKGGDIAASDEFYFNEEFSHPLTRIKVNSIQLKETVEENKETNERVFADRQYQVDAAIVRIMKTRKTLSHTLLMNELFEQLRFPIKPSDLKKRIESLIDREYLERAEEKDVYNYLA